MTYRALTRIIILKDVIETFPSELMSKDKKGFPLSWCNTRFRDNHCIQKQFVFFVNKFALFFSNTNTFCSISFQYVLLANKTRSIVFPAS